MKKEFYGFYDPKTVEIDKSWSEGIFVFDANALLNLYRYSESTRKDFLLALSKLKDRLFMPYQVGYEFHTNRQSVIESLSNSYNILTNTIKDAIEKPFSNILTQYSRHPSLQIENIKKILDDFLKKVNIELEKQKTNHPDFKTKDEVLEQLAELFEGKVGLQFSKDELRKIYNEGKDRYEQQIPPGYKDLDSKRKKGEQHVFGDLVIWKELISYAKKEKKEVVFVTDDRKEDWWTIENGKTIRPREELIKEFYDATGIRVLIYNADNFLHFAKERKLVTKIKDASISEVKEVRKADEEYINVSDLFRTSDTIKARLQEFSPVSSTIADLLKTQELYKASQIYNPVSSTIADLLKTQELYKASQIYNPVSSTIADLLKSQELYKATQFYNQMGSSIKDFLKNDEQPTRVSEVDFKSRGGSSNLDNHFKDESPPQPSKTEDGESEKGTNFGSK